MSRNSAAKSQVLGEAAHVARRVDDGHERDEVDGDEHEPGEAVADQSRCRALLAPPHPPTKIRGRRSRSGTGLSAQQAAMRASTAIGMAKRAKPRNCAMITISERGAERECDKKWNDGLHGVTPSALRIFRMSNVPYFS
jgi:hypothetical protein